MAYDFALDSVTGDFLFGPTRDLIGVTGPELDAQRISIRCKIPRGSFAYDDDGTLGSRLHTISRNPPPNQLIDARAHVAEALDDADGIAIESIDLEVDAFGKLAVDVKFTQTASLDDDDNVSEPDEQPQFDAHIQFSHAE